jgi:hypothetical protein
MPIDSPNRVPSEMARCAKHRTHTRPLFLKPALRRYDLDHESSL